MRHMQHVTIIEHAESHFQILKATTSTRPIIAVLTIADSKATSTQQAAKGGSSSNSSKPEVINGPDLR
jgi:hypothetical protein